MQEEVLTFWFGEIGPKGWFEKSDTVDAGISRRFGAYHAALCADAPRARTLSETPLGALSNLIVLDQFSRNLHRGAAEAFGADPLARDIARGAIARGFHIDPGVVGLGEGKAAIFFFLPFEHSEDLTDQDWSCALFASLGNALYDDFAEQHRTIIRRFGRFPHRNAALGRESTAEERHS